MKAVVTGHWHDGMVRSYHVKVDHHVIQTFDFDPGEDSHEAARRKAYYKAKKRRDQINASPPVCHD